VVVLDVAERRAFLSSAVRWCRTGDKIELEQLVRSPYSGVDHDVGAAYATLASRGVDLLEAIDAQRLAVPTADRDTLLAFAGRLRRLTERAAELEDEPLEGAIAQGFGIADALRPAQPDAAARHDSAVALSEAVDAESPGPVFARQQHFSASALNAYGECARKWFYRYACGAVEDRGSAASAYGTAFHSALEDFHGEFARPNAGDEDAMRARIREYVNWAFERHRDGFETRVAFELQVRRAQRTAQRYVDWLLAEAKRAPFAVIGREVPANVELGDQKFVGFIDRLDRDERTGTVAVVDYKTGSIATTAAEYREKIRKFSDVQLPFYYWARTAEGDRVGRLTLVPLKDARLDVRPVVVEIDPAVIQDLERARSRMIDVSSDLASGRARTFDATDDPEACTFCAYAAACAQKPPPERERFGR
jgi:RecB family exonuclease